MLTYIIRRVLYAIPIIIGVNILTALLFFYVNTPERFEIIKEMNSILQREAPWAWGYYYVSFGLYHSWVGNVKSNAMANNTMKYIRIDGAKRNEKRYAWNRPRYRPVAGAAVIIIVVALLAIVTRKNRRG